MLCSRINQTTIVMKRLLEEGSHKESYGGPLAGILVMPCPQIAPVVHVTVMLQICNPPLEVHLLELNWVFVSVELSP